MSVGRVKGEVRDRETTLDEGNHSVFPLVGTMSQHLVTQNIDKGYGARGMCKPYTSPGLRMVVEIVFTVMGFFMINDRTAVVS